MRTIELEVTITDAAVDDVRTTIFCIRRSSPPTPTPTAAAARRR
jgi:hypothetical protein